MIERRQPRLRDHRAAEQHRDRPQRERCLAHAEQHECKRQGKRRGPARAREQPDDERREQRVARMLAERDEARHALPRHTLTSGVSVASRLSPIPGTSASSSTRRKPPCCWR